MPGIPATIGPYRIIAKLGSGGMATVYRAVQPALQREVALKVVSSQFSGDASFRERFLREARAGAMVNHPNVVTCFDAGNADGQLYLAMELVTGGDLARLLDQRGGRLDETLALTVLRDVARGLEAIEAAKLIHRDLKPANIFLDVRGAAKIADLGLVCFTGDDRLTKPGTVMGTPAYIAPEQARGQPDVDIRADIYSLGATLFHLVTGRPPFMSESPITTLVKALNDPLPDPRSLRADLSPGVVALIIRATGKDRTTRHASARHLREDCERLLSLQTPVPTSTAAANRNPLPAVRPAMPTASSAPIAKAATSPAARMNVEQLQALTRRIVVDHDGLKASLVLAAGATFPRFLLEQVLITAGVVYGLQHEAINEATRASTLPRRIIVARGDPPSPGVNGTSVRGETIPGLDAAVAIVVDDDGLSAVAFTRPGALVTKDQLEPVLRASGLRFGILPVALHRLCEGPADPSGRVTIARGEPMRPGTPAGFRLEPAVANTSADDLGATRNLQRVQPGTVLAHWHIARIGREGMDVFGKSCPATTSPDPQPEDCVGEGTEIGRDRHGNLVLRAIRGGVCQQQESGAVRVVGAVEVAGDFGPDSTPINTQDVVVIRGNVLPGASITSASDVIILGDLNDAKVITGGSLEVVGTIGPGTQSLIAAGTVVAGCIRVRHVMAGNLRVAGEVRNCELLSSGDIRVGKVVGGCLTAGGCVDVGVAGDKDGTTTELWAGHNLSYAQQNELAKLEEGRIDAERTRLVAECRTVEAEYDQAHLKNQRLVASQFVRKENRDAAQSRLSQLEHNRKILSLASEESRKQLAQSRELTRELKGLGDNAGAAVQVKTIAHPGVVARLADIEPETLTEPRLSYRLGTTPVASPPNQPPA